MNKFKTMAISVLLIFAISSSSFANGLSLNSVGTRALGMGGAFVGLANDGTAIYWNPAGLTGQQSAVLVYFTGITPMATYKMELAGIDATAESKIYTAPGLFVNYTMDKWAFGLGVYVPAGLGVTWNSQDIFGPAAGDTEFMSQIGVISISPAVAYQITPEFSLGVAVNINYGMFDMKQPVMEGYGIDAILGTQLGVQQFSEESTGIGVSVTIGAKYDFSDIISAGLTFRTSSKISMSGDATNTLFPLLPTVPPTPPALPNGMMPGPETSSFSRDVTWPIWVAGGVAIHPSDKFTLTVDVQYSQWSELDKLVATYDEAYWEAQMSASGNNEFILNWEDAIQFRYGAEYWVSEPIALRFGYYYDPAPAPDETLNILFPSSTNHVITGGFGYYAEKFRVEAGLEYLFGAERDIEMNATNAMPGIHQMDVFAFSVLFAYNL